MYDVGRCLLADKLKKAKMSQQELANKLDVTKQQVNHYIHGRRIMNITIAKNIAYLLECEIDDLYEWVYVDERKKRQK